MIRRTRVFVAILAIALLDACGAFAVTPPNIATPPPQVVQALTNASQLRGTFGSILWIRPTTIESARILLNEPGIGQGLAAGFPVWVAGVSGNYSISKTRLSRKTPRTYGFGVVAITASSPEKYIAMRMQSHPPPGP